jgi:ATP phosphoribosyltransferase
MNNLANRAGKAKLILVPKGDDSRPCLQAFEDATGIKVPEFENRMLVVKAKGRTFMKVKGRDIPGFIAAGYGDIGLAGCDSCEDYMASNSSVAYEPIGRQMCRFVLLAPANKAAAVRRQLKANRKPLQVATSFPKLLSQRAQLLKLNIIPADSTISGSVEIMPRLLGIPLVADLVASGETARANGLVEIRTLLDVYPAIVLKAPASPPRPAAVSYGDIDRIDAVLNRRSTQLKDKSAQSYTLTLMRDANKAGKKVGEELSEVMMAIAGNGSTADCENEIADLTYAQLVAAYSRGKPVKLSNVMNILIDRNRSGARREDLPKPS